MLRPSPLPSGFTKILVAFALTLVLGGLLFVTRTPASSSSTAAGSVSVTGSMAAARSGHTATTLPNGKVLIAGGMERNGVFLDSVELYDPIAGRFAPTVRMMTRRVSHTATLLPNGKVLIAGGLEGRYMEDGRWKGRTVASAELYDPVSGSFAPTGKMTTPRSSHAATLLANGKVLLAGGSNGDRNISSAELYDSATGRFTPTGSMAVPRIPHVMVPLKDGKVLVAGGTGEDRRVLASAEMYDPSTGSFAPVGSMTTARHKHAAAVLRDGRVLILGGSDERDWRGQYASAELYDPATRSFRPAGSMSAARFKLQAAVLLLKDGKVLIAGGAERVEVYDPATDSFHVAVGSLGTARHFAAAAFLPSGSVLITGGYGDSSEGTTRAWIYRA